MATYRNKNDDTVIRGSEFKVNVNMEPIDGHHMSEVDFVCYFAAGGKGMYLSKDQMRAVYNEGENFSDNYVAPLVANNFGKGVLTIRYEADIPDADFDTVGNADGYMHVIVVIPTKIKIV